MCDFGGESRGESSLASYTKYVRGGERTVLKIVSKKSTRRRVGIHDVY